MEAINAEGAARRTRWMRRSSSAHYCADGHLQAAVRGGADLDGTIEPHMIALRRSGLDIAATEDCASTQSTRPSPAGPSC